MNWLQPIAAVLVVSAVSMIGMATLMIARDLLRKGLLVLVSIAAGTLLGDAFLHLIPEIVEEQGGFPPSAAAGLLGGVIGFFVLEKVLHWHHAHMHTEEVLHPVAITNLVGDGLHNFVDGAIIAGAFLASPRLGIATTVAVALHEIPQEIGDFSILVHAGLKPKQAFLLNLLSAAAALVGAILTLALSPIIEGLRPAIIAVTAGGFVYIASTDLIPELHKEPEGRKSAVQLAGLIVGIGIMAALLWLE